ncbi:hypothetical protein BSKO_05979 [Bryopsis sp. KO-2023]|nr:hypothetical protein BSKO_05979 [Bryopsis sp. KO-2023]
MENEEAEDFFNPELFINQEYVLETFKFGELEQRLFCAKSAVTDFDLTGQIVWPASQILSWLLIAKADAFVKGSTVLEVGAGCGLVGLVSAQLGAGEVVLTDGSEIVVKLLDKTIAALPGDSDCAITSALLPWGSREHVEALFERLPEAHPNIIVGADVFQTTFGRPSLLLGTVKRVLRRSFQNRKPRYAGEYAFYGSVGMRKGTDEELIRKCAEEEAFQIFEVDLPSFLPPDLPREAFSQLEIRVFRFTLSCEVLEGSS